MKRKVYLSKEEKPWEQRPAAIILTNEQINWLSVYLTATHQHRLSEAEACQQLAQETNTDGSLKYPAARNNAIWWEEADVRAMALVKALDQV
ncbi:MAG: hypothetical protein VB085_08690 [Peptococcaceae bacterium]|nr:hypothetical protein [Peptococcaceae bacterium]